MSKKVKSDKRDYIVYQQDDVGNGCMCKVKAKNLKELLKNYFSFPYATDDDESDIEVRKQSTEDLAYDFNVERNDVMVFDVKANKVVIGYS